MTDSFFLRGMERSNSSELTEEDFNKLIELIDRNSVQPCPICKHCFSDSKVMRGIETHEQNDKGGMATCHACGNRFMWEWE